MTLQAELANGVIHAQARLREVKRGTLKFDDAGDNERFVDVSKALIHVIRALADGIAWRELSFDRAAIHELAFAPQTGHIELETAKQEITRAGMVLEEDPGQTVLLNDLTNFMRLGDLTVIKGNSVSIEEVKAGKGSAKSGRATKQKQRVRQVLDFLNRSEQIGVGDHRLSRIRAKPQSYQDEVYEIFSLARKNGHASGRLSNALAISVFDIEVVSGLGLSPDQVLSNPFSEEPYLCPYNSSDLLGIFTPNIAPYSVFPLPPEDRIDLMMGKLMVVAWLDVARLMATVRERGLKTHLPTKEDFDRLPTDLKPGQIWEHELDVPIGFGNRTHSFLAPFSILSRVGYEFLSEESFADMIEEGLTEASTVEEMHYHAFREEYWLWD